MMIKFFHASSSMCSQVKDDISIILLYLKIVMHMRAQSESFLTYDLLKIKITDSIRIKNF